jgi:hypothetical protein
MLFGCYRRGDANDPDTYVNAVAAVLAVYDVDLIREVTDPRTGIQTTEKFSSFMPNAGELRIYCETVAARRDRLRRLGSIAVPAAAPRLAPPEPKPGDLANVFVAETHPRYQRLLGIINDLNPRLWRYGKSLVDGKSGMWVALNVLEDGAIVGRSIGHAASSALKQAAE